MDIQQSVAIVSGGGSGLGAETVKQLALMGAKVVVCDVDFSAAQRVATAVGAYAIACDVTNAEQVEQAFHEVAQKIGPVRICVNCAGIAPGQRLVGREGPMLPAVFERVITVNLMGTFQMMRLAAAHMIPLAPVNTDGERGVIVNTASIAAFEGQIGQVAYAASKGGVAAMTLPAARELAQFGIRVMTIAPGIFETPMMKNMPAAVQETLTDAVPFPRRLGRPEEYAKLVLSIVDNVMLNGEVIRLDGAIRMPAK